MKSAVVSLVILATTLLTVSQAAPQSRTEVVSEALNYLEKYGYIGQHAATDVRQSQGDDEQTLKNALAKLQAFANIAVSGELDEATLELMNTPRCGHPDFQVLANGTDSSPYVLQGNKWASNALTYKITRYTTDLSAATIDAWIATSLSRWDAVSALSFSKACCGVGDIEIWFASGDHGDGYPFDGPLGVLAHAFYPSSSTSGGDIHFDDAETWTVLTSAGFNLYQVATHEVGHSIGLAHSPVSAAAMYPYYTGYKPAFDLDSDDINGVRAIYGA